MIKRLCFSCFIWSALSLASSAAQATKADDTKVNENTKPVSMVEFGANLGFTILGGDVKPLPSYGVGIHVRKAIDYIFSLRADLMYGEMKGADDPGVSIREFGTVWKSGTVSAVMSLNSLGPVSLLKAQKTSIKPVNLYLMAGMGANSSTADFTTEFVRKQTYVNKLSPHAMFGGGVSFRVGDNVNLGIDQQFFVLFSSYADLVDGINNDKFSTQKSSFRDVPSFTNVSVNFNVGNKASKSQPLYWLNPFDAVIKDIQGVEDRVSAKLGSMFEEKFKDGDRDGVIDELDMDFDNDGILNELDDMIEIDTMVTRDVIVDTRGRPLDFDGDGVPDSKDPEPFYKADLANGEVPSETGVVRNKKSTVSDLNAQNLATLAQVKELIAENNNAQNVKITDSRTRVSEWFLPMIHFSLNSSELKYSDYGNLASIARTLRSNLDMRLVVTGFADATGSENFNNVLSYQRAKAVIDHIVSYHNIPRERFILNWEGSSKSLVPVKSSFMNRRVEIAVANPDDVEKPAPDGVIDNKK